MGSSTQLVAGIVAGNNPLHYSTSAPYTLFLFQACFIILLCAAIHYPLNKLQQPKVIAEVLAGIILGPTVLGRIPNFTKQCFPPQSIPGLTLFANIGIILFLFIVGLEVDIAFIRKNLRVAATVGLVNMAIPFGLGCAIATGLYDHYIKDQSENPVKFTTFMVFIAVAMCITAFPVLVRILTELNIIGDRVGTIVLAAGIANDLTGWILLALAITLANASRPVNVVYILLLVVGWFLFLLYPVQISMKYLLHRFTNDLSTGEPLQISMMFILIVVFILAFFTDIIGVHPIFGAFMVGVIVPRDNGYVVRITEKLEDIVHIIMIPLYFAVTGLSVNLGLLDTGIDWGYTIGTIGLAMIGKIVGGFIGAKLNKMLWRESLAVGVLMSCKGIVEIVALTIGLNAGIINQRLYSMFIVMALVTTFVTLPLTLWCYPVSYREKRDEYLRKKAEKERPSANLSDSAETKETKAVLLSDYAIEDLSQYRFPRMLLLLRKVDTIAYLMAFLKNFNTLIPTTGIKALHLRELTSRTSHLLEALSSLAYEDEIDVDRAQGDGVDVSSSAVIELNQSSSILSIVKAFGDLMGITCTCRSILSLARNHLGAINKHVSDPAEFLVTSVKLNELTPDNRDLPLFLRLFHECNCHFGLLIINEHDDQRRTRGDSTVVNYEMEAATLSTASDAVPLAPRGLIDFASVNVVFEHDNLLCASDMLALHLAYRLVASNSLSSVNVFVTSNASRLDRGQTGFEAQLRALFAQNVGTQVNVYYVKDGGLKLAIQLHTSQLANVLFIIANTVDGILLENTQTPRLFSQEVSDVISQSATEKFHVLAVKAASGSAEDRNIL